MSDTVTGKLEIGVFRKLASTLFSTLLFTVSGAAAKEPISLLPIKFEISPDQQLGRKTSGILCAPAGSWKWRDILVNPDSLEAKVSESLSRAGLQIYTVEPEFGEHAKLYDLRLRGRVITYVLNSCVPWRATQKLLGEPRVRGSGYITIIWEVYSSAAGKVVRSEVTRNEFRSLTARDQGALLEQAVATNAEIFGSALKGSGH